MARLKFYGVVNYVNNDGASPTLHDHSLPLFLCAQRENALVLLRRMFTLAVGRAALVQLSLPVDRLLSPSQGRELFARSVGKSVNDIPSDFCAGMLLEPARSFPASAVGKALAAIRDESDCLGVRFFHRDPEFSPSYHTRQRSDDSVILTRMDSEVWLVSVESITPLF